MTSPAPRTRDRSSSTLSVSSQLASMSSSSLSLVASARSADSQPTTTTAATSLFSARSQGDCPTLASVLADESHSATRPCPSPQKSSVAVPVDPTPTGTAHDKLDYLEFLYPTPARPPRYSQVKAARSTMFPVYERPETFILPSYTPAVYNISLVIRKVEWLSPYEASPHRAWRNVIMEINSTQLNFYSLDNMPILSKVKKSKTKKHYEFTPVEQEFIIDTIQKNPAKYLSQSKLLRSYSLQHAKFGLPIDYKKRSSCLRLRCESEQFLIQFISLDNMIEWANYLSIGVNVSLDLDSREMPSDRIVPRRRRNRRNRHRAFSDTDLIRRELAEPRHPRRASFTGESSGLKGKISRLFGRKRSNTVDMEQLARDFGELGSNPTASQSTSDALTNMSTTEPGTHQRHDSTFSNDITTIREEDEEEEEDDDGEDIPDNEIHSIRELHDDSDDDSIHQDFGDYTMRRSSLDSLDEKWTPEPKSYSRRKFLKDSLRCIKLLSNEDSWVGKRIVRATRPPSFDTANKLEHRQAKNKFMEEYIVGLQTFIPAVVHS